MPWVLINLNSLAGNSDEPEFHVSHEQYIDNTICIHFEFSRFSPVLTLALASPQGFYRSTLVYLSTVGPSALNRRFIYLFLHHCKFLYESILETFTIERLPFSIYM